MDTGDLLIAPPAPDTTDRVLRIVGTLLDLDICWLYKRTYYFRLARGVSIEVRPESAGRFRLTAWQDGQLVATLWTHGSDTGRLAGAVGELADALDARV